MKINVAYPATGRQKLFEVNDEIKVRPFYEKRMGQEVDGATLGDEWKGYLLRVTGGNDKQGFPMMQGVLTTSRVRLLLNKDHSCYRQRKAGERKRKSVRGCIVDANMSVISVIIVKKGEQDIPGLTDSTLPNRLGPKRASKIRKFYNLSKEDNVCQYVIKRPIPGKDGKKPRTKAPKIQRLVTPIMLQRKRHRLALKRRRSEKNRQAAAEYAKILAQRQKEAREAKEMRRKRDDGEEVVSSRLVGHNIYILCHQLAIYNKDIGFMLKPQPETMDVKTVEALIFYGSHTAQIEVNRSDQNLEQIVFPIPEICEYLTEETKFKVLTNAERDDQGSKVADFFNKSEDLFNEMKWQKKLRSNPALFWVSSHMSFWSYVIFACTVFINVIVATSYPFAESLPNAGGHLSGVVWAFLLGSAAITITIPTSVAFKCLFLSSILRLILSAGPEITVTLLGIALVVFKGVHLISIMGNMGLFNMPVSQIIFNAELAYHVGYLILCILGLFMHPFFFSVLLFDVVYREETLLNVMKSVTRNGRSILLTAVFAIILVYLFSIIGFIFFKDDFIMDAETVPTTDPRPMDKMTCSAEDDNYSCDSSSSPDVGLLSVSSSESDGVKERSCDSLLMCIVTTLNQGLRNGGGIGDVLRPPSNREPLFAARVVYDMLFFFVVIIIVLNLIFGVIIDTFADLRSEKQQKEEILKNSCFICGLERRAFDNKHVTFEDHTRMEHNMWHYLYFMVLIRVKDPTEFTGPESYVHEMVKKRCLDWFPRLRAISLAIDDVDGEQNEWRSLQKQLESTQSLVQALTSQLLDLRDQMTEQRKQKQRIGLLNNAPSLLNIGNGYNAGTNK